MIDHLRAVLTGPVQRRLCAGIGLVAVSAALIAATGSAKAAVHDYCNWDGSYNYLGAGSWCFQSGDNYLTNNHAYLPYNPSQPIIYCSANYNGSQYAGWTYGNYSCDHPYGGGTLLKAKESVSITSTTHGVISY